MIWQWVDRGNIQQINCNLQTVQHIHFGHMLLSLGIATTIYSLNYKLYYAAMTVIQLDYFSFEILRQIIKQLSLTIISTSIVASIEIVFSGCSNGP